MKPFLLVLAIGCLTQAQSSTLWDYGPTTGTFSASVFDQNGFQMFADRVTLNTDTLITGLNYFTNSASLDGTYFDVMLFADNNGIPGSILSQFDENYDSFALSGTFSGTDIYTAVFTFSPLLFKADTISWTGASGNGFDAQQALISGRGDGQVAVFDGSGFRGFYGQGDQMFQLSGVAVPEPASVVLGFTGLLAFLSIKWLRHA